MTFCLVRCACSTSQRKSALSISDLWRRDLQARRPQGWEAWLAGTERLQIRGSIAGGRTAVAGEPELWNIGNDARQGRYSRPHKQTVSRLHAPGLLASGHRLQSTFDDVHHSRSRSFSKRATTEPSSPHDGTTSRLTSRASQEGTVREEGGDAVSPDVRKKLGNLEYELEIDPFVHMLAAPLRRCVLTSAILPVSLMVRLAMPQPSSEQPARNSVIQEKNDHLNLQDVGDKGHTGRRRENNPKSARLSRIQFPGLTRGRESRGAWLTLDRTVFQSVTKKASASRILAATPADLQHQVETDLATRVLDEVHKTSASLDEESSSSLRECGSRSERPIRCIEWNGLGRLSASPSPGEEHSTLAAVLIFSGQTRAAPKPHSMIVAPDAATAQPSDGISRDEQLPSAPMAEVKSLVEELGKDVGVPVYDIDSLFVDESDRHQHINEFLSLLRPSAERSSPKSALASINAEVQEAETLSGRPMVFEVHKHAYTRDLLIALARLAFYHGRE